MPSILSSFTAVADAAAVQALVAQENRTVVALSHPSDANDAAKQQHLESLAFLLRGRETDLALVQAPADAFALQVYKNGEALPALELEGSIESRALALVEQIGWSPGETSRG